MKNSTFTNFSYNSPVKPSKEDYLQNSSNQNQECQKNISMTPIIKTDYNGNKKGESLTDSKLSKFEEQFKTQKIHINKKQNSLCQDDDANINHGLLRHTNTSEAVLLSQGQNQSLQVKQHSGLVTESPFKSRSKKASQNVPVSCLPNIFQDQDEYNFMRQQQQAIVDGLAIDSKLHPNGSVYKNYQSSRINQQSQINEYSKKKNQIRIRSSQNQDSQKYMMAEDQIIGNKPIHYRVERQAKSNDQRHTNNIKKAIRVQLSKNPALAASLEIYTNGNQQQLQHISKGVQPYVINQFLQKRKNLLQKKVSIHNNSANNRRGQNHSLQYRSDAINVISKNNNNNSYNNNSFNCFLNKSQILDENQANNTSNYSQTQKLTSRKYQNQVKQNNIQPNNIVINNQTNTTNLNTLLSEYRNNSGQQRLLLQDFYNQQGIKDPEFTQKQQSLIDQYNYSKQTLNEKAQSDSPKKLTPQNADNESFVIAQSVKEIKNDHQKAIQKDFNNNDRYEESLSNISYVQNFMDNAYDGLQENDANGQSNNSFLTQSISSHRKLNNNQNSKASFKQKIPSPQSKEATVNTNVEFYEESQTQNEKQQNQIINSNISGQNIQSQTANVNGSPKSRRNTNSNNQTSPVIDFQNIQNSITNKSADQTLSPIKNTKGDKNQSSLIQQRIVLQQQKRRSTFNHTKGGTFSIAGSGDASFDLNLVTQEKNTNNNLSNNQRQFDFYENKSYYQQNMFSPPRIHKTKAVYVHSNTMSNQADISKLNNLEEYNFLNEDQSEKRSQSNPRAVISSFQNDQVLLIKSQVPEQQQQQNLEIKSNIITSAYTVLQKQPDGIYTCYFQKGNNSGLVRRVLLTRSNWRESPVYSSNLNFRWHPFSKGIKFESLSLHKKRIVNHFEFHAEITTKNGIIKNIGRYCSDRGLNIFDFTPTTFLFSLKEKFWDLDLIRFCDFFYKNLPEPLKTQNEYKKNFIEIRSKFRQIQIRTNNQKSNKKKQIGIAAPPGVDKYGEMKIHNTFLGDSQNSYIWLLKPTNLNRGRGIELFSNLLQLETLLNNYFDGFYEQPIQNKAQQPSDDKQTLQQQQDMLLDIAMAESIANQENKQKNEQKEKEEPVLKNLFDKSLYVTPNNIEKEEEKGKKVDQMKKSSNQSNSEDKDFQDKYLIIKNSESRNERDIEIVSNLQQIGSQNQSEQLESEQPKEQQGSPKKNEDGETENKAKKQKIKKNKASISNHNVNYNNNIHIARIRDLSLPKKPTVITTAGTNSNTNSSNNQNKQPNSPEKKSNKNSNGISAEFGGYLMKEHSFVIQKYIEKPFLINERKFDIRMWVLVNQNLDVYLFKEGYIRTSSKKYDVSDQDDIFIHLTNNAIQKYSDSYGQYENGNQLSLDNFDEYLKIKGYKQTFRGDIMPRIKEIITISMLSVKNKLNANDRKYSFELFGYDFFIDQQFNVWLIEINTNPCIEESSPLLGMLIPRMIDDALKLSVDLIFPPQYSDDIIQKQIQKYSQNSKEKKSQNIDNNPNNQQSGQDNQNLPHNSKKGLIESLFPVTGYSSQENMFQFLVNLYKSN
ncbi:hypothetical protein ABPG74_004269 [Tetrahymena malaccensis]